MPSYRPKPGKSFADVCPELVAEWSSDNDYTPEQTTPRSSRKILWCCADCGHQWRTTVNTRSYGGGCPKCVESRRGKSRQKPTPQNSLAAKRADVAAGWHPIKNAPLTAEDVFAGSEVDRWWMCPEGHIEHKSPKKRCHLSVQQTRCLWVFVPTCDTPPR
ncbi:zinc-ribbon domain-containing protein [Corynebacterium variabile]|uniref:zinc-ribbon domain-containing protein n=1 Tax=Corynebacterium variabile TaxID=1727 RepID=UPI003FD20429